MAEEGEKASYVDKGYSQAKSILRRWLCKGTDAAHSLESGVWWWFKFGKGRANRSKDNFQAWGLS